MPIKKTESKKDSTPKKQVKRVTKPKETVASITTKETKPEISIEIVREEHIEPIQNDEPINLQIFKQAHAQEINENNGLSFEAENSEEKIYIPTNKDLTPLFFAFVLGVFLMTLVSLVAYKEEIVKLTTPANKALTGKVNVTSWNKLEGTTQGYPIINPTDKKLKIFDITNKTLKDTGIIAAEGQGELYLGNSDPLLSPNLLFTAYIDNESHDVEIISNGTLNKRKLTNTGDVTYLTAWSPDSTQLIYYIRRDTLHNRKDGPTPWETVEYFKEQPSDGFFSVNIETGTVTRLAALDWFIGFAGNTSIITKTHEDSDKLAIFDTKEVLADFTYVKDTFPFGTSQFSVSADGRKWAFTTSDNPTKDAKIVIADFPLKDGEVSDGGDWAEVQNPVIAPDGTQVVYQKQDGVLKPGIPRNYTWLYTANLVLDENTKDETNDIENPIMLGEGTPRMWLNNTTLIIEKASVNDDNIITRTPYIMDITTGEVTVME